MRIAKQWVIPIPGETHQFRLAPTSRAYEDGSEIQALWTSGKTTPLVDPDDPMTSLVFDCHGEAVLKGVSRRVRVLSHLDNMPFQSKLADALETL